MTTAFASVLLDVRALHKRYANGVVANDGVSFQVERGCIHAIVGENGAGKSTVIKMIYGMERADAGGFSIDDVECRFRSPRDAIAAGVGLVPQHAQLVPSFTVAESLVLGAEPVRGGLVAFAEACRQAEAVGDRYGLRIDPRRRIHGLSVGERQRVEILKALRRGPRLLLLDEPSALLTEQEAGALFASLRAMVEGGMTIVLITHKLAEVREVADRFTVMRGGRVAGGGASREIGSDTLARMIVGRPMAPLQVPRRDVRSGMPALQWRGCTVRASRSRPALDGVSLDVGAGEIVGIAGVEGNGQQLLAALASGRAVPDAGSVLLMGAPVATGGVREARRRGLGMVPEDRLHDGIAPGLGIAENMLALDYDRPPASRRGVLDVRFARERARSWMMRMTVKARDEQAAVGTLSGGNMQKVVFATELGMRPRCLLANQPTRGVDIGAAEVLHRALVALRDGGAAVLLVSSDLDEVFALSDRIAVFYGGRIVAHFAAGQVTQRTVGLYMTGIAADPDAAAMLGSPFTDAAAAATAPREPAA